MLNGLRIRRATLAGWCTPTSRHLREGHVLIPPKMCAPWTDVDDIQLREIESAARAECLWNFVRRYKVQWMWGADWNGQCIRKRGNASDAWGGRRPTTDDRQAARIQEQAHSFPTLAPIARCKRGTGVEGFPVCLSLSPRRYFNGSVRPRRGLIWDIVGFRALCCTRARAIHRRRGSLLFEVQTGRIVYTKASIRLSFSPGARDSGRRRVRVWSRRRDRLPSSTRSVDRDEVAVRRPRLRFALVDDKEKWTFSSMCDPTALLDLVPGEGLLKRPSMDYNEYTYCYGGGRGGWHFFPRCSTTVRGHRESARARRGTNVIFYRSRLDRANRCILYTVLKNGSNKASGKSRWRIILRNLHGWAIGRN